MKNGGLGSISKLPFIVWTGTEYIYGSVTQIYRLFQRQSLTAMCAIIKSCDHLEFLNGLTHLVTLCSNLLSHDSDMFVCMCCIYE